MTGLLMTELTWESKVPFLAAYVSLVPDEIWLLVTRKHFNTLTSSQPWTNTCLFAQLLTLMLDFSCSVWSPHSSESVVEQVHMKEN